MPRKRPDPTPAELSARVTALALVAHAAEARRVGKQRLTDALRVTVLAAFEAGAVTDEIAAVADISPSQVVILRGRNIT